MSRPIEAYRVLFPIGLLFGVLGTVLWILFGLSPESFYPGQAHAQLMVGSFLYAFAAGFLMTAIPKMTLSFPARAYEIGIAALLTLTAGLFSALNLATFFYLASAVSLLFLISFCVRRFLDRKGSPPPFFIFVALGLLAGLVGAAALFLAALGVGGAYTTALAQQLYFQGMILFLVLGVGSRLVPVFLGLATIESLERVVKKDIGPQRTSLVELALRLELPIYGLSLLLSFALEAAGYALLGGIMKATVVTLVALRKWKVLTPGKTSSRLSFGMRLSCFMILAGLWMAVIQLDIAMHWMHLTYVSGFGLMTLTVASRVTLAHGAYDLSFESRSKSLLVVGTLIMMAALTRVVAPFLPDSYINHLVYASLVWILAIAVWSGVFLFRMFRSNMSHQ